MEEQAKATAEDKVDEVVVVAVAVVVGNMLKTKVKQTLSHSPGQVKLHRTHKVSEMAL